MDFQPSLHGLFQEKDHEYANLAHLHPAFPATPPLPKDGTDPVRVFANNWEMHADQDTGRQYYYNRVSGECTWKPPRGLRAKDSGSRMSPGPAPAAPESQPPPSPGRGVGYMEVLPFLIPPSDA